MCQFQSCDVCVCGLVTDVACLNNREVESKDVFLLSTALPPYLSLYHTFIHHFFSPIFNIHSRLFSPTHPRHVSVSNPTSTVITTLLPLYTFSLTPLSFVQPPPFHYTHSPSTSSLHTHSPSHLHSLNKFP